MAECSVSGGIQPPEINEEGYETPENPPAPPVKPPPIKRQPAVRACPIPCVRTDIPADTLTEALPTIIIGVALAFMIGATYREVIQYFSSE